MKRIPLLLSKAVFISLLLIMSSFINQPYAFLKGDIDGDDKVGLAEGVNALQVTSGMRSAMAVKTVNVPGDFATIQEAIDAVTKGDTIIVAAGTYNETLFISKNHITLQGSGAGSTIIDGGGQNVVTINGSQGLVFEGFTLQNGSFGIFSLCATLEVNDVIVQDNSSDGIHIDGNTAVLFNDCMVYRSNQAGIVVFRNSTATFGGTIISNDNTGDGIRVHMTSNAFFDEAAVTVNSNGLSGISIYGSSSCGVLESTINSRDNIGNGIGIAGGSCFTHANNNILLTENNGIAGIAVSGSSRIYVNNATTLTTRNNGDIGLSVAGTSNAEIYGNIIAENNGDNGLLVFLSSSAMFDDGSSIEVRGSGGNGIQIYENSELRAEGTVVSENNAHAGIMAMRSSTLVLYGASLPAEIRNNDGIGIDISHNSTGRFNPGTVIHDNSGDGLLVHKESCIYAEGFKVQNNGGKGLSGDDGSNVHCVNATINGNTGGDVSLTFGSQSTLNGNTIGSLPISCDGTCLSRGDAVCP
jgi:hypothetical protein